MVLCPGENRAAGRIAGPRRFSDASRTIRVLASSARFALVYQLGGAVTALLCKSHIAVFTHSVSKSMFQQSQLTPDKHAAGHLRVTQPLNLLREAQTGIDRPVNEW